MKSVSLTASDLRIVVSRMADSRVIFLPNVCSSEDVVPVHEIYTECDKNTEIYLSAATMGIYRQLLEMYAVLHECTQLRNTKV